MNDSERFLSSNLISRNFAAMGITLVVVVALRLAIYYWLRTHGYFYGIPWDSFSRTLISYAWAKEPFFTPSDGYWLPLQFWLVGSFFALIRPWIPTSEILVPVVINNIFFIGSVSVLFFLMLKISKKPILAFLACVMAGFFAGDVFVAYSALSEPMLIFFILLASYLFHEMHPAEQKVHPRIVIKTSIIVLLAAATHYIGWFLAIFFCLYFFSNLVAAYRQKNYPDLLLYVTAAIICAIFPLIWALNDLVLSGSPFGFIQIAQQHQEKFIGKMDLIHRLLVPPGILLKEFYPLMIPGLLTIAVIWRCKEWKSLVYILPGSFVFASIWISTLLALSAPYQEPRYLVVFGWLLIPALVIGLDLLWRNQRKPGKIVGWLLLIFVLFFNVWQISAFRNSFDNDVQIVAYKTRNWLLTFPDNSRIYLHSIPDAERDVFRLISGRPEKVQTLNENPINPIERVFSQSDSHLEIPTLLITLDRKLVQQAKELNLKIERIGKFRLISNQ